MLQSSVAGSKHRGPDGRELVGRNISRGFPNENNTSLSLPLTGVVATMNRESRHVLNKVIMEVVENQLRDGNPPETKQTLDRLLKDGIEEREAKRLIACVVTSEIYDIMRFEQPYNRERFVNALHRLPQLPWD
jgi:hypothetical protein